MRDRQVEICRPDPAADVMIIGFTISLFIASLAFSRPDMLTEAKVGIFLGSLLSMAAGWLFLRFLGGAR